MLVLVLALVPVLVRVRVPVQVQVPMAVPMLLRVRVAAPTVPRSVLPIPTDHSSQAGKTAAGGATINRPHTQGSALPHPHPLRSWA